MTHPPRVVARALALVLTAGALALTPSAAHAVDPIPGPQTSGDVLFPNVGNGGYDVEHYDLDIVWTAPVIPGVSPDSIAAVATIDATTTGAPLSSYAFDLEGLTVSSVTVNGTAATFARTQDATAIKYKLVVTPAAPVSGDFTTVVTYNGTPTSHLDADFSSEGWGRTSDGVIFLNQPIGAMTGFPNNNTPSDKATYDVSIDIPSVLSSGPAAAVSNGELASNTPNTPSVGRTTWRWVQQEQQASMAMMLSIGNYNVTQRDITLASGRVLPEWTFIDPNASGATAAATAATNLKKYIDFFETQYGPYPGNSTGIVVDQIGTSSLINYALETQDRAFFPNSVGTSTNIHETMHQWWGDGVSPKVWNDIWISEGAASYSEVQYPNESTPQTSTTTPETANYNLWNSTAAGSSNWSVPPAGMTDPADLFGWQTYNRSEMVYAALETVIGTADYDEFMLEWQDRYNGESPGTAGFIALAEEISGRQLDAFFQDWLYDADKPAWPGKFNLSLASNPTGGPVQPNNSVTYTISVVNTGKVVLSGAVIELDLADVLDDADLGSLPANTTVSGNTVTWNVPSTALSATSTVAIPTTVKSTATTGNLVTSVRAATLGGTCTGCGSTLSINANPVSPSATPTVTGTAKVGATLTAVPGAWDPLATLAYQWTRNGVAIVGAQAATYDVTPADLGTLLRVVVTGTRSGFTATVTTSDPTAAVMPGDLVLTPTPTISGTPKVGETLTAQPGTWDSGVAFAYQWTADGVDIADANAASYIPVADDEGKAITVKVTGSKVAYNSETETSAPSAPVALGDQVATPTPTITGTPKLGQTLTAVPGTWDAGVTKTYQWAANGTDIGGATGTTYDPVVGDIGKTITVTVTGTKAGYATVTKTSAPTAAVAEGTQASTPTPTITGTPKFGQALTAVPGTWDVGVTKTYQWAANGTDVVGATATTYSPVVGDIGKTITVKVTGTRSGYTTVTRTSAPTTAVSAADQSSTPTPTIAGTVRVGKTLTADVGTWDAGSSQTYQWLADGSPITGATSTTYALVAGDLGKRITFAVTSTRSGYTTVSRTSAQSAPVAKGRLAKGPVPTIKGKAKVGKTLTVLPGSYPAGITLSFQWYLGMKPVSGATAATFKLTNAAQGQRVSVKVMQTKPGYQSRRAKSLRTLIVV